MYMALVKTKKDVTYILRESIALNGKLIHADLFDLGPSPGAWIDYPGGNAWYLDERLEASVSSACRKFDSDELEGLFRPWLRPDIRRAVEVFWDRGESKKKPPRLTDLQKETISRTTPAFDKRRAHFLKFKNMDQGPLPTMPAVLFKDLQQKSRDEIEQHFMAMEKELAPDDLKSYVYTIFDLQSFFQGFMAKLMPHALDQDKVETFFLQEICRINSSLFGLASHLADYLIRYVIMFFDHEYTDTVLLEEMERAFRFRHRSFKPQPPPKAFSVSKALTLFHLTTEELKTLKKGALTKIYRKLARKHHPDKGGSHDQFVDINNAYQILLERIE